MLHPGAVSHAVDGHRRSVAARRCCIHKAPIDLCAVVDVGIAVQAFHVRIESVIRYTRTIVALVAHRVIETSVPLVIANGTGALQHRRGGDQEKENKWP